MAREAVEDVEVKVGVRGFYNDFARFYGSNKGFLDGMYFPAAIAQLFRCPIVLKSE